MRAKIYILLAFLTVMLTRSYGQTTIFTTQVPTGGTLTDNRQIELGVKFRSSQAGSVLGIRFYKTSGNTGTHVGQLYTGAGALLATATFSGETATGWQTVTFAAPIAIQPNVTYVAAYWSGSDFYTSTDNFWATGVTNAPLTGLANGVDGPNGVFLYTSTPAFPNTAATSSNYWVDVVFSAGATANAGPDQTLVLPTNSTLLDGRNSSGPITAYSWTQVSGPSTAVLGTPSNVTTTVTNLIGGTYVFQLVVSPGSSMDQVTIFVTSNASFSFSITPTPSGTEIFNPGRGANMWQHLAWNNASGQGVNIPAGNSVPSPSYYTRFGWKEIEADNSDSVNLIVIWGESNAVGLAPNSSAPAGEVGVRSAMHVYYDGTHTIQTLNIGVNNQLSTAGTTTHGLELGMANGVDSGRIGAAGTVYICKIAVSGTHIAEWLPENGATLWGTYMPLVDQAIAAVKAINPNVRVSVWGSIGLNDKFNPANTVTPDSFQVRLQRFVADFRNHINNQNVQFYMTNFYNPPAQTWDWGPYLQNIVNVDPKFHSIPVTGATYIDVTTHWDYAGLKIIASNIMDTMVNQGLGTYNWTTFDQRVNQAVSAGQTFSFGVMPICDGCGTNGLIPTYLHNMMQNGFYAAFKDWNYSTDNIWIPNWNALAYLDRYRSILYAIARHLKLTTYGGFNGYSTVYEVDIRGYGNFGEWHTSPWYNSEPGFAHATDPTLDTLLKMNVEAFPDLPNVNLIGAFDQNAASFMTNPVIYFALVTLKNQWGNIGWRRDNWGEPGYDAILVNNPWSFNGVNFKDSIMARWQTAPVLGEPSNSAANTGVQADLGREVNLYKPGSIGNGNWSDATSATLQANAQAASLIEGYRLLINDGTMPTSLFQGVPWQLSVHWLNRGVATLYEPFIIYYQLRNAGGTTVVWQSASGFNPRFFLPSGLAAWTDNFTLPASVPIGNYDLWVKLVDPKGYRKALALEITNTRSTDGAYLLRAGVSVGNNIPPPPTGGMYIIKGYRYRNHQWVDP